MKPIKFKEQNLILKPFYPEHGELPIFANGEQCLSCWKMNSWERLSALIFGKAWIGILTHNKTQPPIWIKCERTAFEKEGK